MKKEIWKDILGYEGLYQVSNFGRVKSLKFGKERILKLIKDKDGYFIVNLYKNKKIKSFRVHRLVAEAFIDNPDNLPQVNHKDENPSNNVVSNLEWCNAKYNINFGTRSKKVSKKLSKPVLQYTLDGEFVREWKSYSECKRNGFNHVDMVCRGKRKSCGGFIWRYKKDLVHPRS